MVRMKMRMTDPHAEADYGTCMVRLHFDNIKVTAPSSDIPTPLVSREAVQILGGIGYTRGGQGDRVERAYREIKAITIPGGSEEVSPNGIHSHRICA